jgi:hypothetical protein
MACCVPSQTVSKLSSNCLQTAYKRSRQMTMYLFYKNSPFKASCFVVRTCIKWPLLTRKHTTFFYSTTFYHHSGKYSLMQEPLQKQLSLVPQ